MRNVHREQVEQVMGEFVEVVGDQTSLGVGADGIHPQDAHPGPRRGQGQQPDRPHPPRRRHQRPGQPEVDGAACRGRRDPLRTPADPGHRGRLPSIPTRPPRCSAISTTRCAWISSCASPR
ncbi:hypothetical protein ACHWUR_00305 [Klebsiella pneumoniae]